LLDAELNELRASVAARFNQLLAARLSFETYPEAVRVVSAIKQFARRAGLQLMFRRQAVTLQCSGSPHSIRASIEVRTHKNGKQKTIFTSVRLPKLASRPVR
jgi:hypothetical protein